MRELSPEHPQGAFAQHALIVGNPAPVEQEPDIRETGDQNQEERVPMAGAFSDPVQLLHAPTILLGSVCCCTGRRPESDLLGGREEIEADYVPQRSDPIPPPDLLPFRVGAPAGAITGAVVDRDDLDLERHGADPLDDGRDRPLLVVRGDDDRELQKRAPCMNVPATSPMTRKRTMAAMTTTPVYPAALSSGAFMSTGSPRNRR